MNKKYTAMIIVAFLCLMFLGKAMGATVLAHGVIVGDGLSPANADDARTQLLNSSIPTDVIVTSASINPGDRAYMYFLVHATFAELANLTSIGTSNYHADVNSPNYASLSFRQGTNNWFVPYDAGGTRLAAGPGDPAVTAFDVGADHYLIRSPNPSSPILDLNSPGAPPFGNNGPRVDGDYDQLQFFLSGSPLAGTSRATYGAVPEPTVGMLLLLGVGTIFIRRRR